MTLINCVIFPKTIYLKYIYSNVQYRLSIIQNLIYHSGVICYNINNSSLSMGLLMH